MFQLQGESSEDQPLTGVEKTIWYIDYVLRHNETDLSLYKYLLLDVIAVILF